ncbi:DNA polymerase III subunit psi [Paraglaciecola sp.]|uniref:DNA polymerase III subunit psi n=1 Tax=Paraglaciecola sp. TaxID=1920173 RepID=UPI003263CA5D
MKISTWALTSVNKSESDSEESKGDDAMSLPANTASSVSKENALSKLQQLKSKQSHFKETTSVLTTFNRDDAASPLFADILLMLEISTDELQYIESGQEKDYRGYPFALIKSNLIGLENKQLSTPSLDLLKVNPDLKKRLWNTLQIAKTNY